MPRIGFFSVLEMRLPRDVSVRISAFRMEVFVKPSRTDATLLFFESGWVLLFDVPFTLTLVSNQNAAMQPAELAFNVAADVQGISTGVER